MRQAALTAGLALIPEQLPAYVEAVSGSRLVPGGSFPAYRYGTSLVLVAFPSALDLARGGWETQLPDSAAEALRTAAADRAITRITLLSASAVTSEVDGFTRASVGQDVFRALSLPYGRRKETAKPQATDADDWRRFASGKLRAMLARAAREVTVAEEAWCRESASLAESYRARPDLADGTRHIFGRVDAYLAVASEARLFAARHRESGRVEALAVADFTSLSTAMYLFAFRQAGAVPGAADLILAHIVLEAEKRGCERLNLGLDIDPGIGFFKRKWGALPFLDYYEATWTRETRLQGFLQRLRGR